MMPRFAILFDPTHFFQEAHFKNDLKNITPENLE